MEEQKDDRVLSPLQPVFSLMFFFFIGMYIFSVISQYFFNTYFPIEFADFENYPNFRYVLLSSQIVMAVFVFLGSGFALMKYNHIPLNVIIDLDSINLKMAGLSAAIIIVSFPFNVSLQEAMMNIEFSEELILLEKQAEKMTLYLIDMTNFWDMIFVFVVVAIVAGITEEFFFRGLLQPLLYNVFKNIHIAIWVSATIFSLIHFQIYGFPSRIIMGAILGYIMYWSGSVKYAMIAHAASNGFQVIITYIIISSESKVDVLEKASFPIYIVVMSVIFTLGLMFYMKNKMNKYEVGNNI